MPEISFIPKPRADHRSARYAFFASLVFHALAFGSALGLVVYYRTHLPQIQTGSPPGSTTITLQKMIVVPEPVAPTPLSSPVIMPESEIPITLPTPPRVTIVPKPPEVGVPVLPSLPAPVKTASPKVKATASTANTRVKQTLVPPKTEASVASSYAPGREDLPHPPYPLEARDRHQTGTVVMDVRFDANGSVEQARVSQSSGVPVLDSETKSFIRANWHSSVYAGQTISVPVEYMLQQL